MNVRPSTSFTTTYDATTTGLVGTIKAGIYQGDTAETALTTSGVNEIGTTGIYVATLTSPATAGQYQIIWSLDGTLTPDQLSIDDLTVTFSAPADSPAGDMYGTTDELFRILKIRTPTIDQTTAAERVLIAAAGEINAEIDLADGVDLADWQLQLVTLTALDRAADLWRHVENIAGITGLLGDETSLALPGRYSWERYAQRLAPVKNQWGLA